MSTSQLLAVKTRSTIEDLSCLLVDDMRVISYRLIAYIAFRLCVKQKLGCAMIVLGYSGPGLFHIGVHCQTPEVCTDPFFSALAS